MTAARSAASKLIQRRALQGSFSSVFYLKNAGWGKAAKESEQIFVVTIVFPMAVLGAGGAWHMLKA
eukprot:CAMPEP_0198134128 /NCGR_PEP_ID=MMETSP1442-20131203/59921_1 /TAXON_ID= /ORGANISM="Craspedostauros australis, Strain CCMP3328" /LENGTH=65 /DNA_ID=CAMNT_0043795267 /DNA_START=161 /DNA_END=358 /DNA_ORIENTATION=+